MHVFENKGRDKKPGDDEKHINADKPAAALYRAAPKSVTNALTVRAGRPLD